MNAGGSGRVRALICEDEPLAVRALREYLKDVDWIEIVGDARDGREAARSIQKLEPDLVFLDVQMPGLTGLEVLEIVTHRPAVVFTTAYDQYAVTAFEEGAVDYLLKPFGRDRLLETLNRVRVRLVGEGVLAAGDGDEVGTRGAAGRPTERIFARDRGALVPLEVNDIVRLEAADNGVEVVTPSGRYELDATLTELEGRLDPSDFVRIHRAHIVNLAHVVSIRRYDDRRLSVRLDDGETVVASRRGSRSLRELAG